MFCISLGEVTFLLKLVNGKRMHNYVLKPTTLMNQGKLWISRGKTYHFKLCFYEFNHKIFKQLSLKSIIQATR